MNLKAFNRTLWVYHLNTGSCNGCDIEILAVLTPRYDVERFGVMLVGSPRHADVLLVTGPVGRNIENTVRRIYEQSSGRLTSVRILRKCHSERNIKKEPLAL